jgi:hypothetical protein
VGTRKKNWALREYFVQGKNNVKNKSLVEIHKILMPPLHIKLGLIKQFIKALDKNSTTMQYLPVLFPHSSKAKIEAGIFNGPDIHKMFLSQQFEEAMHELNEKMKLFAFPPKNNICRLMIITMVI